LHGGGAWEANPFVAAISFRVIKANIDSVKELEAA
jgi:fructose/tagatose bisphosphate aldolase